MSDKIQYNDIPRIEENYKIDLEYPDYFEISQISYRCRSVIVSGKISNIKPDRLGQKIKEEIFRLLQELKEYQKDKIEKIERLGCKGCDYNKDKDCLEGCRKLICLEEQEKEREDNKIH